MTPSNRLPAPIARLARLQRLMLAGGGALIALAAIWALLPLPSRDPPEIALDQAPSEPLSPENREPSFSVAAFDAPIWVAPPPGDAQSKQAEPPPPPARIALELVAIESNGGTLRAALYDPQAKKLTTAGAGETIAGHEISSIGRNEVTVTIEGRTGVLKLREEPPPVELESLQRRVGSRTQ